MNPWTIGQTCYHLDEFIDTYDHNRLVDKYLEDVNGDIYQGVSPMLIWRHGGKL